MRACTFTAQHNTRSMNTFITLHSNHIRSKIYLIESQAFKYLSNVKYLQCVIYIFKVKEEWKKNLAGCK